jgi:uncharacterized damage-inducible protein DinB
MGTSSANILVELYKYNHDIIHQQLAEISHEESLLQLPFRGNCMNWVVGHILGVRGEALELMGLPGTLNLAEEKVYGYGSDPLADPANACDLGSMVKRLDDSLARVIYGLDSLSSAELNSQVRIWRGPMPLIAALSYVQWHESYHTGQLELLRQLAGKNDKVI